MSKVEDLFLEYQGWYNKNVTTPYVVNRASKPETISQPFDHLKKVSVGDLTKLKQDYPSLPGDYLEILSKFGLGNFFCATNYDDAAKYKFVSSENFTEIRSNALSWLDSEIIEHEKRDLKFDPKCLIPILTTEEDTTYVFLAADHTPDNRVYFFGHDWEQRYENDAKFFSGPYTVVEFFEYFFEMAKRRNPLSGDPLHACEFSKMQKSLKK